MFPEVCLNNQNGPEAGSSIRFFRRFYANITRFLTKTRLPKQNSLVLELAMCGLYIRTAQKN